MLIHIPFENQTIMACPAATDPFRNLMPVLNRVVKPLDLHPTHFPPSFTVLVGRSVEYSVVRIFWDTPRTS